MGFSFLDEGALMIIKVISGEIKFNEK